MNFLEKRLGTLCLIATLCMFASVSFAQDTTMVITIEPEYVALVDTTGDGRFDCTTSFDSLKKVKWHIFKIEGTFRSNRTDVIEMCDATGTYYIFPDKLTDTPTIQRCAGPVEGDQAK